ncbi:MAG TPA: nucleotide exchange factor GrpE [Candidatus Thermoplasmatota archaeon]|nr:nucleotide exchange factor GrpE [Candidatus Thermoplasmatota archaeon]
MTDTTEAAGDPAAPAAGPDEARARFETDLAAARAEVEKARAEAAEHLDRLRRLQADFDNFRRRARKDVDEAREKGREAMLLPFLAILDNVDRALEQSGSEEALYEGVRLIFRDMRALLEKEGIERIDTEGHPFDANVHEAVMREETDAYAPGVVIKELERGYRLRGRVLRPAKVKVAAARPAPDETADEPAGEP